MKRSFDEVSNEANNLTDKNIASTIKNNSECSDCNKDCNIDCTLCYNEIEHIVMYKKNTFDKWYETTVCMDCILHLKATQYGDYLNNVQTTDCKRTLKRLLDMGPPIWVSDEHIFKNVNCEQNEHVIQFKCNGEVTPAKLDGSVDGIEREQLWESLKNLRE